jgi:hypothetical protein
MQQMTEWLTELGLGRNAQLFGENGIDCSVLPYLADQDLEKLGVRQCAIALCKTLEDAQRLFPCLHDQFYCNLATGHLPIALRYAERCQSLPPQTGDRLMRLIPHRSMGSALQEMSEFSGARTQLCQAISRHDTEQDTELAVPYTSDPSADPRAVSAKASIRARL